ncbi:hypothetical protein DOTSEDRAFT_81093 [Dothistroma septosporum NZE10]|uniref:F-box domain-containing protein n=1 Tax=Dothistroma septosporum (strain NZE10 / CBS 128990) TaxID=675120 RepID=N1PJ11_DOTSN|nr:hypothetical protein DOTSEDRAFT_81093 [Dothistroma septosporum NZE10]
MHILSAPAPKFYPANQHKPSISTDAPEAATQAVLNTVKLMEQVFEYLIPRQLLTTSHVCKIFNTVIKTSPSCQQALFQRPNPKTIPTTWSWNGPYPVKVQDAVEYIKVDEDKGFRQDEAMRIHYLNPLLLHLSDLGAFDQAIGS